MWKSSNGQVRQRSLALCTSPTTTKRNLAKLRQEVCSGNVMLGIDEFYWKRRQCICKEKPVTIIMFHFDLQTLLRNLNSMIPQFNISLRY